MSGACPANDGCPLMTQKTLGADLLSSTDLFVHPQIIHPLPPTAMGKPWPEEVPAHMALSLCRRDR